MCSESRNFVRVPSRRYDPKLSHGRGMAFQFRNRPYVTEGGVDPQSVVNFLKDIKGYPTHLDARGNST